MAERTLRELAREYAKGTLGRDAYRKSRSDLLEGILAGSVAVRANDYPPPAAAPRGPAEGNAQKRNRRSRPAAADTTDATRDDITAVVTDPTRPPITPREEPKRSPVGMIAGAIGVAVLILVAVIMGRSDRDTAPAPAPQPGPGEAGVAAAAPEPADQTSLQLIRDFLQKKSWTDAAMQEFRGAWQALTEEQRATATGSPEMTRLANAIVKQMQEEQALSTLGDGAEAESKQQRLLGFAAELGINDPRLKVQDTPAPETEAGAAGDGVIPVAPEAPRNGSTG